jgi:hypothetical protein
MKKAAEDNLFTDIQQAIVDTLAEVEAFDSIMCKMNANIRPGHILHPKLRAQINTTM